LQVKLCDPCLSALEVVTTMRYTNRRLLYLLYFTVYSRRRGYGVQSRLFVRALKGKQLELAQHQTWYTFILYSKSLGMH